MSNPFLSIALLFAAAAALAQSPPPAVPTEPAATETAVAPAEAAVAPSLPLPVDEATAEAIRTVGIHNSQAMRLLRDLCGKVGHRLTGSDNFTKACNWAAAEFEKMGLSNVHLEKWGEWNLAWNRGSWVGRIVSPVWLDMYVATEAWTAGTNGPQRGRVLRAPKTAEDVEAQKAELAGTFLFWGTKRPARAVKQACEAAGILGWVYRAGDPDAKFPTRVRVFGNDRVARGSLDNVPKVPEIAVQADHADRLAELLDAPDGPEVVCEFDIQNSFRPGPIVLHNVIAEIPGTEKPDEVVIVCGHLDSWHQKQGTTDNGTGATSTMESARILASVGAKPKRTIRFCLWGGEEQGLLGSAEYVKRHRTEMNKVSAVFNHDTGTNWAQSITVGTTMKAAMEAVFAPVMKLTPPDADWDGPVFKLNASNRVAGGGGSDHASFLAAGVPGLNWGLRGRSNYFQHTWHTQWDTIDNAIEEYQRHTSTVIALAALGTANLPDLLDRTNVSRGGGNQAASYAQALFDGDMEGFKFTKLTKDGRGDKIGLQPGDVLVKVDGQEIGQMFEIFRIARDTEAEFVTFTVKRGQQLVDLKMKKSDIGSPSRGRNPGERFGAEVDGRKFTKIQKDGLAARIGLQDGDELVKVNDTPIERVNELFRIAAELDSLEVTITVKRADKELNMVVKKADLESRGGQ